MAQDLVLGWLRDVAANGERSGSCRPRAGSGSGGRSASCGRSPGSWKRGLRLEEQVEARIQELTRTKDGGGRDSIEKSIVGLGQRKKGLEEKQTLVLDCHPPDGILLQEPGDHFTDYRRWIREVLDQTGEGLSSASTG